MGFFDVMRRLISLSTLVPISCISVLFSAGLLSVGMKLSPRESTSTCASLRMTFPMVKIEELGICLTRLLKSSFLLWVSCYFWLT